MNANGKLVFHYIRLLAALGISVYAGWAYLTSSLGSANLIEILSKAPSVILAKERLAANPFVQDKYWEKNKYVDGNIATLPYPHYWPLLEMIDKIKESIKSRLPWQKYKLLYLTNYEWMTGDFVRYKIMQNSLQDVLEYSLPLPPPKGRTPAQIITANDFIILKTGRILKNDFYGLDWAKASQAFVDLLTADDYSFLKKHDFELMGRYDLPDGSEGTVWKSSLSLARYSLIQALPSAKKSAIPPGFNAVSSFTINDEMRYVLFQHPVIEPEINELSFENMPIYPGSKLVFGIAMDPSSWSPDKGDGVEFILEISCDGLRRRLFDKYIDPKNKPEDRRWHDFEIDLNEFANKEVTFFLKTKPGPNNNVTTDWAGWSDLTIMPQRFTRQSLKQ